MNTFSNKFKQNSYEISLIKMRCKQRRLGDSIYEYNSDWPSSSCEYNGFKLAINEIKIMFHTTD